MSRGEIMGQHAVCSLREMDTAPQRIWDFLADGKKHVARQGRRNISAER